LRSLQKRTGVTFIYITHDQSEALAMSDRIAVMSAGVVQQVGAPRDLYDNPQTPFVASFVGETNAVAGRIAQIADGFAVIETGAGRLRGRAGPGLASGQAATLYVRPEALVTVAGAENRLAATVERVDFEGAFALAHGHFEDGAALVASIPGVELASAPQIGERASFSFAPERAVVLPDG